jgi:hypothetical protein
MPQRATVTMNMHVLDRLRGTSAVIDDALSTAHTAKRRAMKSRRSRRLTQHGGQGGLQDGSPACVTGPLTSASRRTLTRRSREIICSPIKFPIDAGLPSGLRYDIRIGCAGDSTPNPNRRQAEGSPHPSAARLSSCGHTG